MEIEDPINSEKLEKRENDPSRTDYIIKRRKLK